MRVKNVYEELAVRHQDLKARLKEYKESKTCEGYHFAILELEREIYFIHMLLIKEGKEDLLPENQE